MNKTTTLFTRSAICLSTIISTSVIAVEGLFATVGVTNNYLWRGLEQTNGASAISGGINRIKGELKVPPIFKRISAYN